MQIGTSEKETCAEHSFLVRLSTGSDLLDAIATAFKERQIRKAAFNAIGAVTHAVLGFYDADSRLYVSKEFPGQWEIVSCSGNVSVKEGDVFVHAHVVLSGHDFKCAGGHLMPGTLIFAAELYGSSVPGPVPVRSFDDTTGLALWGVS